jgi:hypothetical protein
MSVDELLKNKLGLEVLTDTGWNKFDGLLIKGIKDTVTLTLENSSIDLTYDHGVYLENLTKVEAGSLQPGQKIKTKSGLQKVMFVKHKRAEPVYDLLNVGDNHRFYANDILCSNCEFIIADETLINPNTLIQLQGIEPITRMGQVRWYNRPEKGKIYVVALDPSLGTGGDPAAIQIFEASTTTQIGEWKHNKTDIPSQIKLIAEINKYIVECTGEPNNLYYSVENNSIGEASLVSLNEYGEANILGTFLSEPGKKRKGFNTTNKTKLAACAKFKTLLESKKMSIQSRSLISELKSFVASGGSYAAKIGDTDDLIMASLLSVRIMQQLADFHGELGSQIRDHDEIIAPLPFFAVLG